MFNKKRFIKIVILIISFCILPIICFAIGLYMNYDVLDYEYFFDITDESHSKLSLLLLSFSKKFNIKVDNTDYYGIYNLMLEINDKAKNNDIDYFRMAIYEDVEIDYNILNNLREAYQKQDLSLEEFRDYYEISEIEILIREMLKVDILKTYKIRAYASNNGINFNYHWTEKDVHFQMYIIKDYSIFDLTENHDYAKIKNGWKLIALWRCR